MNDEIDDDSFFIHGDIRKQFLDDEVKLKRHRETYAQTRAIVFCVRCGSTTVDQNFTTELRCYECGTTLEWNSRKFSIRRDPASGEGDVLAAFRGMKKSVRKRTLRGWSSQGDQ